MIRLLSTQNTTIPAVLQGLFARFCSRADEVETTHNQLRKDFNVLKDELKQTQVDLERKKDELQIATDYLDTLLSHISQGILFIDLDGIIVIYNEAASQILGKNPESILFRPFWENFDDEAFGFSIKSSLKSHKCPAIIVTSWTKDNQQKDEPLLELEISPSFFSKHNKVEGLVIRIRNITEMRRLQVTANRQDRLTEIGSMASKVAHEIRNPLGGIKGFASLLERDLKEQPKMQEMAKAISEGADELNELVSNILDYSRPLALHPEEIDLVALAKDIHKNILADSHYNPNISMTIDAKPSSIKAFVDPHLLKSALLNLVLNGIQAMPDGGNLTFSIQEYDRQIIIQIIDTGIGIPESILNKIWTPFFTTKEKGNGLGLALVHKIIDSHQGTIDVVSESGKGSKFTVKIPKS